MPDHTEDEVEEEVEEEQEEENEEHNLQVRDLNEIFLCIICNGYLIRPVAITECCHYFCRSCIVKVCIICNGYLIRPVAITECCHYFCRSCIVKVCSYLYVCYMPYIPSVFTGSSRRHD